LYLSEVELIGPDEPETIESEKDEQDDQKGNDDFVQMTDLQANDNYVQKGTSILMLLENYRGSKVTVAM